MQVKNGTIADGRKITVCFSLFLTSSTSLFDQRSLWPSPRIIPVHQFYRHHRQHLLEQLLDVSFVFLSKEQSLVERAVRFAALSTNRPMPLLISSSSLSPDAPMWMPLTPPSSAATWRLSPESQSNGWINTSPPLSSSPLSMLFPPLLPPPPPVRVERATENENSNNHRQKINNEPMT